MLNGHNCEDFGRASGRRHVSFLFCTTELRFNHEDTILYTICSSAVFEQCLYLVSMVHEGLDLEVLLLRCAGRYDVQVRVVRLWACSSLVCTVFCCALRVVLSSCGYTRFNTRFAVCGRM